VDDPQLSAMGKAAMAAVAGFREVSASAAEVARILEEVALAIESGDDETTAQLQQPLVAQFTRFHEALSVTTEATDQLSLLGGEPAD
jgi:hypothetical protein